jgi:2Fe-2S ferredoxin
MAFRCRWAESSRCSAPSHDRLGVGIFYQPLGAPFEVITRDGERLDVEGAADASVMEAIRDAGVDDLRAMCGGCCSCATCHVYVEAGRENLPPPGPDEDDLLDSSAWRTDQSRLSCQLAMRDIGPGCRIRIAPED